MRGDKGMSLTVTLESADSDLWPWPLVHDPADDRTKYMVKAVIPIPDDGAVAKIFHAVYRRSEGVTGRTWQETRASSPSSDVVQRVLDGATKVFDSPGTEEVVGERVRWRDVVESMGLTWHPGVNYRTVGLAGGGSWPSDLWGPAEGRLDDAQLASLVRVLRDMGGCSRAVACHPFWQCEPKEQVRWRFDVPDLPKVRRDPVNYYGTGPAETMAVDGSWFLLQDIDLCFTLLSGRRALIDAVLTDPSLEAIEVQPDHRVDRLADVVNRS